MSNKTGPTRDAFTFSLGGLTTIASFVPAPAIADNQIRQQRADRKADVSTQRDSEQDQQEDGHSSAA